MSMKITIIAIAYVLMISVTYGYSQRLWSCHETSYERACYTDAGGAGIVWPVFWVFHVGTLMFEPDDE